MTPIWNNRIVGYADVAPSEITAHPLNARTHPAHQAEALRGILSEVGVVQNIIINERSGRLIDGHLRVALALKAGQPTVPVTLVNLTEAEESLVLATLDPISAMAGVDAGALEQLLAQTDTADSAVQALLDQLAADAGLGLELPPTPGAGGDEFDATPTEGPTRCQPGDLWLIGGRHRLLIGDSTDAHAVERLLDGKRPVLVVTDPPYGVRYDPSWRAAAGINSATGMMGRVANDDRADWTDAYALWNPQIIYVWHAGRYSAEVAGHLETAGYEIIAQIIWAKDRFALSRGDYHWQHEPCWYAVRAGETHNWQGARDQSTLWEIRRLSSNAADSAEAVWGHGTQKPLACMEKPIHNNSSVGDLIADPFLGSGTTLIAAHRLGRVCYGMELDPAYGDVILRRAEAEGLTIDRIGEEE